MDVSFFLFTTRDLKKLCECEQKQNAVICKSQKFRFHHDGTWQTQRWS